MIRIILENFDSPQALGLFALIFIAAVLYSSVGHGGASGYLAAMALFGVAPAAMKPLALSMNIMVAGLGFVRLARAGYFKFNLFWPFALGSIPAAYFGGAWQLTDASYRAIVGIALLLAAWRMFAEHNDDMARRHPPFAAALLLGAGIGLLSGLTGIGGGIFLSPILLMLHWTTMRESATLAAAFILVNSVAGLAGYAGSPHAAWPESLWLFLLVALAGGLLGSELAVRRLAPAILKRLLGVVLIVAAGKMLWT
ncbi:MAG: sulfite exporter TauE/SafE family protein [Hydrogenophilales bacterium]|nr:sulfite exporter TauE/SafE family protein [Hydrogenophilales bacterium]